MTTKNNSPETVKNRPSPLDVCKIYSSYAFGEALVQTGKLEIDFFGVRQFPSHKPVFYILNEIGERTDPIKKTKLLVKPLGEISKEDCWDVVKIICGDYMDNLQIGKHPMAYHGTDKMELAEKIVRDEWLFGRNPIKIEQHLLDFLRDRGYALPYKNWSVKELEEFGIYKLIK